MAKRAQQGSGEERVTAKLRPVMNLTARMPSVVSSSTSSNPGRTSCGYQDPGKSVASDDRSGKPEKSSWNMMQQVAPHREEPLLDGNAHYSRVYLVVWQNQLGTQKIQIKYVDTKNNLTDLLTKDNFTVMNGTTFSVCSTSWACKMFSCSHFKSIIKSKIMSKRQQEGKTGRRRSNGGEKEHKSVSDAGFGCIKQPGEFRNAKSEFRSFQHRETDCERCERCGWKTQHPVLKCGTRKKTFVPALGHQSGKCYIDSVKQSWPTTLSKYSMFQHLEKVFANVRRKLSRHERDEI